MQWFLVGPLRSGVPNPTLARLVAAEVCVMSFKQLDSRMRVFETAHDLCVLPHLFIVARIDGRSFTRLTKEEHDFEAPFDARFRDCMIATTRHLFECGFGVVYGYTQSDEISLLLEPGDGSFGRKLRKLNSVLAGEASAAFTHALGAPAAFDCRVSQLPRRQDVLDYFQWRQRDAHRNALGAHCYWLLRKQGMSEGAATGRLNGASVSERNELLFRNGINFNELPLWQRRGTGVFWETYTKLGTNPITGEQVEASRRRMKTDLQLPMKEDYDAFVGAFLS